MTEWKLTTPIALFLFNRPHTTERVIDALRAVQPPRLFIIADGPRPNVPGDAECCTAARSVVDRIDWPCELAMNYADTNLGCNARVESGLDWVFGQVEKAIILEDDCVPHPTFFPYCEELLEKYRTDRRVMMISGNHYLPGPRRTPASYYFSRVVLNQVWGWATWRRAWQLYDPLSRQWPEIDAGGWLEDILVDKPAVAFYRHHFQKGARGELALTWDYRWSFTCWMEHGLCITPYVNLVTNIGFGAGATNAHYTGSELADVPLGAIEPPLVHPRFVTQDREADRYLMAKFTSLAEPTRNKVRRRKRRRVRKRRDTPLKKQVLARKRGSKPKRKRTGTGTTGARRKRSSRTRPRIEEEKRWV